MIRRAVAKGTRHSAPTRAPDGNARRSLIQGSCRAVTVPAYLIAHAERHGDDTLLEDETLTLELADGWAIFRDAAGPCYAVPREQVRSILRVDEDQDPEYQEPAPQKE